MKYLLLSLLIIILVLVGFAFGYDSQIDEEQYFVLEHGYAAKEIMYRLPYETNKARRQMLSRQLFRIIKRLNDCINGGLCNMYYYYDTHPDCAALTKTADLVGNCQADY